MTTPGMMDSLPHQLGCRPNCGNVFFKTAEWRSLAQRQQSEVLHRPLHARAAMPYSALQSNLTINYKIWAALSMSLGEESRPIRNTSQKMCRVAP